MHSSINLLSLCFLSLALLVATQSGCSSSPADQSNEIILKVTGADTDEARKAVDEELKTMSDRPGNYNTSMNWSTGKPLTIKFGPVADPQKFAEKVKFGKVDKIEDRTVFITYTN